MEQVSRATTGRRPDAGGARLLPTFTDQQIAQTLSLRAAKNPAPEATLGDVGLGVRLIGPARFDEVVLVQPFERAALGGVDVGTLRTFRWDGRARTFTPVWNSGANVGLGYVWSRVRRPGVYTVIGLPRDRLLRELIRRMAVLRRLRDPIDEDDDAAITRTALAPFLELAAEDFNDVRELLARIEIQTSVEGLPYADVEMGTGGHPAGFALPGRADHEALRRRLESLEVVRGGLPEEHLFYPPDVPDNDGPPWPTAPSLGPWNGIDWRAYDHLPILKRYDWELIERLLPRWFFSRDWWMYQHDQRHTGHASGASDITAASVSGLYLHATVNVDGPVVTKPSIVDGKIYIGSGKQGGGGGTLYKIDLSTGSIEHSLATAGTAFYSWVSGIGGSPAVVGDRVYFTGVHGTVYCVNANTFSPIWSVSLKSADLAHNQPVTNPNSDCWSGPLVVNGRVYVGCGEGESATTYGFVFCLDASTGNVLWCFCTCKFTAAANNQPNHIPAAVAAPWAASHGFVVQANPPETGCSVWSSCAYDGVSGRIFVGTGNSQYPHTEQPDELYGSGLLSLDAVSGAFAGFFQPAPDDSYFPGDSDIDVPGSPAVYTAGGQRVVAFGSKNGSFFVLQAANINNVIARRQLLPRVGGTGLPGARGTAIPAVVPTGGSGENSYGILASPAVSPGLHRIFIGLGGYNGMHLDATGIDQTRTPFLRALNWTDLHDAWPTAVGADNVIRYTTTKPPMYASLEVGLSSPAVVNDVVLVSTSAPPFGGTKPGFYALSANDGHCLWSAGGLPTGPFALGPSVYGNFVVVGAGNRVYIYKLGPCWRFPWPILYRRPWPWEIVERVGPTLPDPPIEPWLGPTTDLQVKAKQGPATRGRRRARAK